MTNFHQWLMSFESRVEEGRKEMDQTLKEMEGQAEGLSDGRFEGLWHAHVGTLEKHNQLMNLLLEGFSHIDKHIQLTKNTLNLPK